MINLDKLTYAGTDLLRDAPGTQYRFVQGDVADQTLVQELLKEEAIEQIVHLAAETHVDRSIDGPSPFFRSNALGTFSLLESVRAYLSSRPTHLAQNFRLLNISTDEVYGSIAAPEMTSESAPFQPGSPYSATKAAADHFVGTYYNTYGLPCLTIRASNTFGPRQFPEKLIPLMTLFALEGRKLPIYGDGQQVRDWLHVNDHVEAVLRVLAVGRVGQVYNVGGGNLLSNLQLVTYIVDLVHEFRRQASFEGDCPVPAEVEFVADRPGHDARYALNCNKIRAELGWAPQTAFLRGLRETIAWYAKNRDWTSRVLAHGQYNLDRLGNV